MNEKNRPYVSFHNITIITYNFVFLSVFVCLSICLFVPLLTWHLKGIFHFFRGLLDLYFILMKGLYSRMAKALFCSNERWVSSPTWFISSHHIFYKNWSFFLYVESSYNLIYKDKSVMSKVNFLAEILVFFLSF